MCVAGQALGAPQEGTPSHTVLSDQCKWQSPPATAPLEAVVERLQRPAVCCGWKLLVGGKVFLYAGPPTTQYMVFPNQSRRSVGSRLARPRKHNNIEVRIL